MNRGLMKELATWAGKSSYSEVNNSDFRAQKELGASTQLERVAKRQTTIPSKPHTVSRDVPHLFRDLNTMLTT